MIVRILKTLLKKGRGCYFGETYFIKLWEVVEMDEFRIEFYMDSGDNQNIKLSGLNEKDMEQWKKDMEARALNEYYNKKVKIRQKIWF